MKNRRTALFLFIVLYILIFSSLRILKYNTFHSEDFDSGQYFQGIWNILHSGTFYESHDGWNYLRCHFMPGLSLYAPLYLFFESPITILIIQTILISLGAIPVYFLILRNIKNKKLALTCAGIYFLYPALEYCNIADFRPFMTVISLILFAFYYLETNKIKLFYLFLGLSLIFKEELFILSIGTGFYIAFKYKKYKWGILHSILSLLLFIVVLNFIIPSFGEQGDDAGYIYINTQSYYSHIGDSITGILSYITNHLFDFLNLLFDKYSLNYIFYLFIPLMLVPLLNLTSLWFLIPVLSYHLAGPYWLKNNHTYFQSPVVSLVIFAFILGVSKIHKKFSIKYNKKVHSINIFLIPFILFLTLFFNYLDSPLPFSISFNKSFYNEPRAAHLRAALKLIPPEFSVMATKKFYPFLFNREYWYMPHYKNISEDYIIMDFSDKSGVTEFDYSINIRTLQKLKNYIKSGKYSVIYFSHNIIVLKKGNNPFKIGNKVEITAFKTNFFSLNTKNMKIANGIESAMKRYCLEYFKWSSQDEFYKPKIFIFPTRKGYFGPYPDGIHNIDIKFGSFSIYPEDFFIEAQFSLNDPDFSSPVSIFYNNTKSYIANFPIDITKLSEGFNEIYIRARTHYNGWQTHRILVMKDSISPEIIVKKREYGYYSYNPGKIFEVYFTDDKNTISAYYSINDPDFKIKNYIGIKLLDKNSPYADDIKFSSLDQWFYPRFLIEFCGKKCYREKWGIPWDKLKKGKNLIYCQAIDIAGNKSNVETFIFFKQ